jgi:uncharacterized protein
VHSDHKIDRLRAILRPYGRLAIAFSGGADSSLLAKCALDTLGTNNVLLLFAESELLKAREVERVAQWLAANGCPPDVALERVPFHPLSWEEFTRNSEDRCYSCKLRIYSLFREHMAKRHFSLLADGTNADDLKSHRPGLRAIHELGVLTPLVEAGLSKPDVRLLGRQMGLAGWNNPSDSCLATRIPTGLSITSGRLRQIEQLEEGLGLLGLHGCRVRLDPRDARCVRLETADSNFEILLDAAIRSSILLFFRNNGIETVLINLAGRESSSFL